MSDETQTLTVLKTEGGGYRLHDGEQGRAAERLEINGRSIAADRLHADVEAVDYELDEGEDGTGVLRIEV